MKKSILGKILVITAAVLFVTDTALLILGFSSVSATVRKARASCARSAAEAAADLLYGADMEKLRTDETAAEPYRKMLKDLCRTNDLQYLYVYIPDEEHQTITYVLCVCVDDSVRWAKQKRVPGMVVRHELSRSELFAWNKSESGQTEEAEDMSRLEETDNEFGHVLTAHSVVCDSAGDPTALVGADVSVEEGIRVFVRRYRVMFAAVVFSFIFVLGVLAAILKIRVLKPAEIISRRMKTFVSDRESSFEKVEIKGSDEFAQMADAFNNMAQDIDRYIRNINILTEEKHRRETEISIAANIQKGFLPGENCLSHGIRLTAAMLPARYVGGDFYDYFSLSEDAICTVIADVSGKGISAALFMTRALTVVRQYACLGYSPAEILFHANQALAAENPEQMFLTVFAGIYNSSSHKYVYANGGHHPPYLLSSPEKERAGGAGQRAIGKLDGVSGMAVGIFGDETYEEAEIILKEGDTVFLYTDGVNEAVNQDRELFGTDRLERVLRGDGRSENSEEENGREADMVLDAVREYTEGTPQSDDITVLSFCVQPDSGTAPERKAGREAQDRIGRKPGVRSHIKVAAEVRNLGAVQSFLLQNEAVPADRKNRLCLATEEIFVNICSYAYGSKQGDVEISIEVSDKITMEFIDTGKKFNPLLNLEDVEDYDLDTKNGGLGRYIAFHLADKADYRYLGHKNILTLIFK